MSSGKPLRGVVVYDIELEGGVAAAAEFQRILKQYSDGFLDYLKEVNPRLEQVVNFTQWQAEVPLQERRGATGPLDQIVFRGTRGGYSKVDVTDVRVLEVNKAKETIIVMPVIHPKKGGNIDAKGQHFEYPLSKVSSVGRDKILADWALGVEKPRILPIKTETFERYAKPI